MVEYALYLVAFILLVLLGPLYLDVRDRRRARIQPARRFLMRSPEMTKPANPTLRKDDGPNDEPTNAQKDATDALKGAGQNLDPLECPECHGRAIRGSTVIYHKSNCPRYSRVPITGPC
jgi:hypothetical protein